MKDLNISNCCFVLAGVMCNLSGSIFVEISAVSNTKGLEESVVQLEGCDVLVAMRNTINMLWCEAKRLYGCPYLRGLTEVAPRLMTRMNNLQIARTRD
jgi:hypothetical protein